MSVPLRVFCSKSLLRSVYRVKASQTNQVLYCTKPTYQSVYPQVIASSKAADLKGVVDEKWNNKTVKSILKKMNIGDGVDLDKIYKYRPGKDIKHKMQFAELDVLSKGDIDRHNAELTKKGVNSISKFPPYIKEPRKEIDVVIQEDLDLISHDDDGADIVLLDIGRQHNNFTRPMVKRENTTGILREANWEERDRINNIYWPRKHEEEEIPGILEEPHLSINFDRHKHEDVLDLLYTHLVQIDAPEHLEMLHRVYEDIGQRKGFDVLSSTKYYGGMVWYFVVNKRSSELIDHYYSSKRLPHAANMVRLHALAHDELKCDIESDDKTLLDYFVKFYKHSLPNQMEEKHRQRLRIERQQVDDGGAGGDVRRMNPGQRDRGMRPKDRKPEFLRPKRR